MRYEKAYKRFRELDRVRVMPTYCGFASEGAPYDRHNLHHLQPSERVAVRNGAAVMPIVLVAIAVRDAQCVRGWTVEREESCRERTWAMSRGIVRMVRRAHKATQDYMTASTDQNNLYSRGLASEGYAGGYRDALSDVLLALNGVEPNRYPYWPRNEKER